MSVTFTVNGARRTVDVEGSTPLLYVLRNDLELRGPRFGCGLGQCGACTVLIKGEAVRSCVRPVSAVQGADITTLEGLSRDGQLHPVQQAWIAEQVPQCGFCQNGQILTAAALLEANPDPTDAEIRKGMAGTLCRCMTYYRVQAAIKRAARDMAADAADRGAADGADVADRGAADGADAADHGAADGADVADHGAADGADAADHRAADGADAADAGTADSADGARRDRMAEEARA